MAQNNIRHLYKKPVNAKMFLSFYFIIFLKAFQVQSTTVAYDQAILFKYFLLNKIYVKYESLCYS